MPLLTHSSYTAPPLLANGHLQTIFPTLFRHLPPVHFQRERIQTSDNDFLDLDWAGNHRDNLAILSHGLEGDSSRPYIAGMIHALHRNRWDALAWNLRGCSGEPNLLLRFYHSGATEDLDDVIRHALSRHPCRQLALIGFSLGGNMTLKYLGEPNRPLLPRITRAVAISVPCDLTSSSIKMARLSNRHYMVAFLRSLRRKIRAKSRSWPNHINDHGFRRLRTFNDFDQRYTAPLHGFDSAEDYWRRASSKPFLRNITLPTLLINARNDPFLAAPCYPVAEAASNPHLHLEIPASGGHVGFISFNSSKEYWSETRTVQFLQGTAE